VDADDSRCESCGTPLAASDAEGLCPGCLLHLAIGHVPGGVGPFQPLIAAGDRLGPYEVVSFISRGGMGEVYRATDTRLGRTVAIKLLLPGVVERTNRRDRFELEARSISSLNHRHICSLHDIGEQEGMPFLVMEYVDGETLLQRLARGALPAEDVWRHAIEIADALDHAHQRGVIHRDLKPANIMLTDAGVKLLDFGVAKLRAHPALAGSAAPVAGLPSTMTEDGTAIGTLQYMAPEQLDGCDADARTDIFAFGAVLYEMATGQRAFGGSSRNSVIAAILAEDPPPCSTVCRGAPATLDGIVARCLAKRADDRWQTASELRQALIRASDAVPRAGLGPDLARRMPRAFSAIAAIAVVCAIGLIAAAARWRAVDTRAYRFVVPPPDAGSFNQSAAFMAVSPDGQSLAFVASSREGRNILWVRPLDSLDARPLVGTDDAGQPFWSPDSRFLAFGRTSGPDTLNTIDVVNGLPRTVDGTRAMPGAWNQDGVILFSAGRRQGGLMRVPAGGGVAKPVTVLDASRDEISHAWPQFLPDGRHFIFLARSTQPQLDGVVYAGSLDSPDRVRLIRADSQAAYVPQGYLIFLRVNTLVAHAFDPTSLRVSGDPIPIAEQVERTAGTFRGAFSVSRTGVLAYRTVAETALTWHDRSGRRLESVGAVGHYSNPALSPDEKRLAVARLDPDSGASDIWVMDLARDGLASRITVDAAPEDMPLWGPDGRRIVFRSPTGLQERASKDGEDVTLLPSKGSRVGFPQDWSRRRDALVYQARGADTGFDLWMLPMLGDRTPVPLLRTEFQEGYARLSPDGRWMAYVSDESGQYEVYVRGFPDGGATHRVSSHGGLEPSWSGSGQELFYLAPDRSLMSVAVKTGPTFESSLPVRLFDTRMSFVFNPTYTRNQYVVSADARRFLLNQPPDAPPSSPITVVVNWHASVKP
jgi:Tol biopolymer transport system component/predicted Ser/Thr protein kinase